MSLAHTDMDSLVDLVPVPFTKKKKKNKFAVCVVVTDIFQGHKCYVILSKEWVIFQICKAVSATYLSIPFFAFLAMIQIFVLLF